MLSDLLGAEPVVVRIRSVVRNVLHGGKLLRTENRYSDCLVFVLGGATDYAFDSGDRVEARENGVLYLPKDSSYRMNVMTEYPVLFVDFDFQPSDTPRRPFWFSAPELLSEFERLYRDWTAPTAGSREQAFASLYRILARLSRAEGAETSDERAMLTAGVEYLGRHALDPELRIADCAAACGRSEPYFRRLFRRVYGQTPGGYLTDLRIRRAQELLQTGEMSVTETALASGYSDVYYFCRVFRQKTGLTPTEYKRNGLKL